MKTLKSSYFAPIVLSAFAVLLWLYIFPGFAQSEAQSDLAIQKSVIPESVLEPGDAIQYTLVFSNAGVITATDVLITDTLPAILTGVEVTSSIPVTRTNSVWQVGNLLPNQGGTITLTAFISPALTSEFTFTNTATIVSSITDTQSANNTSWVVSEINLPPIVDAGPNMEVNPGMPFTLEATFTDPGLDDTHVVGITWGDGVEGTGMVNQSAQTITATHTYSSTGQFNVSLLVTDSDGGQGSDSLLVTVEEVMFFQFLPIMSIVTGNPLNSVALYPSPNSFQAPQQVTISVNYGTEIISDTVTDQSFIVQSFQRGVVTGTFSVAGDIVSFSPGRSFQPGETIQTSLTTEIGAILGNETIHPDFSTTWEFHVASAGGSGFMLPGSTPGFGSGDSTDLALGDLDLDGDWDVVVANLDTPSGTVWVNDGAGNFSAHPTTPGFGTGGSQAVALGDLDRDGDLDAIFATLSSETIWLNDGQGNFAPHPTIPAFGSGSSLDVALGDVDGDGYLDAIVANTSGEAETVWLNDGTGSFPPHLSVPDFGGGNSTDVELGDVDGDMDLDVVVANTGGESETVWLNDGSGGFTPHPITPAFGAGDSQASVLCDLDLDGDLDAIVANINGEAETVWLNDGTGNFISHPAIPSFGEGNSTSLARGDLDSDKDLDIIVANGLGESETVWLNDGLGGFSSSENPPNFGTGDSHAIGLGDLDGDGDLDAVVANTNGEGETVWLNGEMKILSTEPAGNGTVIAADGVITVTFDRDVNPDTVNTATFVVNGGFTGRYPGSFSFPSGNQVVFTPSIPFKPEEPLFMTLTRGIGDATVNLPLHPYVWELRGAANGGSGVLVLHSDYPTFEFGDKQEFLTGDLDGDGDQDAIAFFSVLSTDGNRIWLNDGNAGFVPHPVTPQMGMNFYDGVLGDLDGDGDLDAIGNSLDIDNGTAWFIWKNDGTGSFSLLSENPSFGEYNQPTYEPPLLADLDGDGDLDALIKNFQFSPLIQKYQIWLNDGTGEFSPHPIIPVWDCCYTFIDVGDVNGDGSLDLIQATSFGAQQEGIASIWLNDGTGNFQLNPVGLHLLDDPYGPVSLGDLDGDSDLDAVIPVYGNGYSVWLNDGNGNFSLHPTTPFIFTTNGNGELFELADLNGDSYLDCITFGWAIAGYTAEIWLNDGLGNFSHHPTNPLIGYGVTADLAVGDFDGDGDVEFITLAAFVGDPDYIWLNQNE